MMWATVAAELEMQQLKQRLLETEAQMTRILQAMETVAEKVEGQTADVPPQQVFESHLEGMWLSGSGIRFDDIISGLLAGSNSHHWLFVKCK